MPPLLFKADVNFSQISNLVLVVVVLRGSETSQPHKTLQYHPIFNLIFASKPLIPAFFTHKLLIFHQLSSQSHFYQTSATTRHISPKSQNRLKCPKFRVSQPQMNNYTSRPTKLIVEPPMGQIWAYFISTSVQDIWQP